MKKSHLGGLGVAVLAATFIAGPAMAQKSKDTLRIAFLEATHNADPATDPAAPLPRRPAR